MTMQGRPGKKQNLISFHPRKQHNFEQAAALAELFPGKFKHVTSVYFGPLLIKMLRKIAPQYARQLGKRSYPGLPKRYVRTLPATELKLWMLQRKHGPAHLSDYMNLNDYWQKNVLQHYEAPEVCISYDSISRHLFREWKNKSVLILDLAIGLPQYRLKIEHGEGFNLGMLEEVDEVRRKLFKWYQEEIELADVILCGSEFVKKTVLFFYPDLENKCKVLPYGTDLEEFSFSERKFRAGEDLKFAFVGRLSLRKGAHLMMESWRKFVVGHPMAELHFFGTPDKEISVEDLPDNVFCHGWINKADLISSLKSMDVFVFPTTFEGSSIAVFQAMALKLPVITTLNSGTVLEHGKSCEIVEAGNTDSLLYAMEKVFRDTEYRQTLAENAFLLSKNYSWDHYKTKLGEILKEAGFN